MANRLMSAAIGALLLGMVASLAQAQGLKAVYRFTGGSDGASPECTPLLLDGKLYGTTLYGGSAAAPAGSGTIFSVDLATGQETTLHTFMGGTADGGAPSTTGLMADSAGNLYGTTPGGGASNKGVVFKLDSSGNLTLLHSFSGSDGWYPLGGLVADRAGNLYGTTQGGGPYNAGTIFKIDSGGNFSLLYGFGPGLKPEQKGPNSTLLLADGNLYGTTSGNGITEVGTAYRVNAATGAYQVLHYFSGGPAGAHPFGGFIVGGAGKLYGVAYNGGGNSNQGIVSRHKRPLSGDGMVFSLDLKAHQFKALYTFSGDTRTHNPRNPTGIVRDAQGNLYGTTANGGTYNNGTVFKLDTAGNLTVLDVLKGAGQGGIPLGGLTMGPTGKMYGTASQWGLAPLGCGSCGGTVFEVVP